MFRDKVIWRRATSIGGLKPSYNSITAVIHRLKAYHAFPFKAVIPWIFGLSITALAADITNDLLLRLIQVIYLMSFVAILAIITIYISLRCPAGPQLVDASVSDGRLRNVMYWGDKFSSGVYNAGFSQEKLSAAT
jgi:hypothetical protein